MQLNESFVLRDSGLSNADQAEGAPRHRWYPIKEAFSPKLVQTALSERSGKAAIVVDPFGGSGTVPLEAALAGAVGVAIEVNPFLSFVARAKLSAAQCDSVAGLADVAYAEGMRGCVSALEGFSTFTSAKSGKCLFNVEVIRAFEGAWRAIDGRSQSADVVRLALLSAAMASCNAARDGKCLRYRKLWDKAGHTGATFLDIFRKRVFDYCDDLTMAPLDGDARVISGDSRELGASLPKFDLCITSPPYLNSFDYTDVYRPELFLGRFVRNMKQLRSLRQRTVRSHVQAAWVLPKEDDFGALYAAAVQELSRKSLWSTKLPVMVQAYFEDMKRVLKHLRRRAKRNASLWLVVSTSAYAGVEIPVDLITAEIGVSVGWSLREVGVLRNLRSSGQHWSRSGTPLPPLRESVVIWDL